MRQAVRWERVCGIWHPGNSVISYIYIMKAFEIKSTPKFHSPSHSMLTTRVNCCPCHAPHCCLAAICRSTSCASCRNSLITLCNALILRLKLGLKENRVLLLPPGPPDLRPSQSWKCRWKWPFYRVGSSGGLVSLRLGKTSEKSKIDGPGE